MLFKSIKKEHLKIIWQKNWSLIFEKLQSSKGFVTMTDPAMARLMLEGPKELKAITVNGQIIVETDDDRERWTYSVSVKETLWDNILFTGKEQPEQLKGNLGRSECMKRISNSTISLGGTLAATTLARSTLPRGCRPSSTWRGWVTRRRRRSTCWTCRLGRSLPRWEPQPSAYLSILKIARLPLNQSTTAKASEWTQGLRSWSELVKRIMIS